MTHGPARFTMRAVHVITNPTDLSAVAQGVLVPTMGALHDGHLALVRSAAGLGRPVIVSVFVNPAQFGPGDDLDRYPRTLDHDVAAAAEAGADIVFAPNVEAMYPPGEEMNDPPLPAVATTPGLEDACRAGHFAGVARAVGRLFDLVRPSTAVFGEKDFQQLRVVQAIVAADTRRWGALQIVAAPTVREADGLAMSSRNAFLDAASRERAASLWRALEAARVIAARTRASATADAPPSLPGDAEVAMHRVLESAGLEVDYAVIRRADSLLPMEEWTWPARAIIAARLGDVRLIDNAAVGG